MTPLLYWILGGATLTGTALAFSSSGKSSSEKSKPIPFNNPQDYFNELSKQTIEIQNLKNNRQAESDERVKNWKVTFKDIPLLGPFTGALIDIGNFFGKLLGSAYKEENSPEDIQYASDWIATYLQNGYVPNHIEFTGKSGANSYGLKLANQFNIIAKLPTIQKNAMASIGILTIRDSGNPSMIQGIKEAALGAGSLGGTGWFTVDGKLKQVGSNSIIAGIAASEYGVSFDKANEFSLNQYRAGKSIADNFIATMQAASGGKI